MDATAKLVAIVLLASFAIERITATIGYFLDSRRLKRIDDEAAVKAREKRRRKLILTVIAGALSLAVVLVVNLRILSVLAFQAHALVDLFLTWLILFAGADRIRDFLAGGGGNGASASKSETPVFQLHVHDDAELREVSRAS